MAHSQSSVDLWVRNSQLENYDYGDRPEQSNYDYYTPHSQDTEQSVAEEPVPIAQATNIRYSLGGPDTSSMMHDVLLLAHFCSLAHPPYSESENDVREAYASWNEVRAWLRAHTATEVTIAASQRDESGKTALHMACQNSPPDDVIDVLLTIAGEIAQWPDNFGWLPIHYSCAYASSSHVIKCLAEIYPASKTLVDRKGRTPLHFALGTTNAHSADVVMILSSTGAASYPDDNGMLPLHYACAYGASEDCLLVLTDAYSDAVSFMDQRRRTPLHFTLSNAGRPAAPAAVRLLLGLNRDLVNAKDGSPLPLKVLAEFASLLGKHQKAERDSCKACLKHLIAAHPIPTPDFFTALQQLPDFLRDYAVVTRHVQELLNYKIAQRFCTLILMLDFYVQCVVIFFYSFNIHDSINERFEPNPTDTKISLARLCPLYVGATYFFLREVINFFSLLTMGALRSWAYEPSSWLNVLYVLVVYFWTFTMTLGSLSPTAFRTGASLSTIFLWTKVLSYLRNMMIEFAVFAGGVFHVMRRLAAFLVCLTIILIAFSRMFYTLYQATEYCAEGPTGGATEEEILTLMICENFEVNQWCNGWDSFLAVYTMLLGNVDDTQFEGNIVGTILFVLYMFLVVILLSNVLIAIVTDSYKVIQDQRAAIVFWTNRLNFIAQMDAIAHGPWRKLLRKALGLQVKQYHESSAWTSVLAERYWKNLMDLYEDDIYANVISLEYFLVSLVRLLVGIVIIPAWILLGFVTLGWLWPPQIREYFFTSAIAKHSSETAKEEELRHVQIINIKAELLGLGEALRGELAQDRTQIVQTKSLVAERKMAINAEMKNIKRIVTMLFEQQASG